MDELDVAETAVKEKKSKTTKTAKKPATKRKSKTTAAKSTAVKTTAAKVSAGIAVVVPLLSQFPLIYDPLSAFLAGIIPFYALLGELEGIVLILTGIFALISGVFYLLKRPKDAKPVETFPELDEELGKNR